MDRNSMSAPTTRLARSYLFAPGSHERLLEKVFGAGADAVVIDLEDAVALEHKALARRQVSAALAARGRVAGGPLVFVRINGVQSGLWRDDLDAVVCEGLDGVRVARTESPEELAEVDAELSRLEATRQLANGTLSIIPSIESAAGVLGAARIAAGPRVRALAFGSTDFLRDIGGVASQDDHETLHARSHLVLVSRMAAIQPPVMSVFTRLVDLEGLRISSEAGRRLGFFGRSCIHPSQVPIVHRVFTPSSAELTEARMVVEAAESQESRGSPAVTLPDGQLVDRIVVLRARAILDLNAALNREPGAEETHYAG